MKPLVSIIIPAYNAQAFIGSAVASACGQTYKNLEIIVVNDGSTDATSQIVNDLASSDARIILIELAHNQGVSAARNAAFRRASGEWIAVLDADDGFAPERIQYMIKFALAHNLDMVADNLAMRDFSTGLPCGNAFPEEWMNCQNHISLRYLLERDIPGIYCREMAFMKPLMRRAFLLENNIFYDESLSLAEDLLLYITCLRCGAKLRLITSAFYIYNIRPGSISSRGDANLGSKKVTLMMLKTLAITDPSYLALLQLRLSAVNFELFIWFFRARRIYTAIAIMLEIEFGFFIKKIFAACLRRLGFQPLNPARIALDKIKAS